VASFGVVLSSRAGHADGILVIVDERQIAEERGKGHDVDVEELVGNVARLTHSGERTATP